MGWWMVTSGLTERTEVSQYRLALHLVSALAILALTVWTSAEMYRPRRRTPQRFRASGAQGGRRRFMPCSHGPVTRALAALLALVVVTAGSGALVAGLRAGKIYNTFPLMGDGLVPPGYGQLSPWWANLFENPAAVQFNHRVLATVTFLAAVAVWALFRRSATGRLTTTLNLVLGVAMLQLTLGITTLLLSVPVGIAVAHQGGAALLLTTVLLALHESLVVGSPHQQPTSQEFVANAPPRPLGVMP